MPRALAARHALPLHRPGRRTHLHMVVRAA
jgi:hypothetical protein